ncbi:MAG: hypothetical protein AAGE61_17095, partial [Pseudomonadota bacterium]
MLMWMWCSRTLSGSAAPTPRSCSRNIPPDRRVPPRENGKQVMPGLMTGKRGLIMGVANDHSIAWG